MRLCRYHHNKANHIGLYDDKAIVPLAAAAKAYAEATHDNVKLPEGDDLLALLPPDGVASAAAKKVADWAANGAGTMLASVTIAADKVELLRPIPSPINCFCWRVTTMSIFKKGAAQRPNARRRSPMSS